MRSLRRNDADGKNKTAVLTWVDGPAKPDRHRGAEMPGRTCASWRRATEGSRTQDEQRAERAPMGQRTSGAERDPRDGG